MNWTSTKVPLWQIDCHEFVKTGRPVELRDVTTPDHDEFVLAFSTKHNLSVKKKGTTVIFLPRPPE